MHGLYADCAIVGLFTDGQGEYNAGKTQLSILIIELSSLTIWGFDLSKPKIHPD